MRSIPGKRPDRQRSLIKRTSPNEISSNSNANQTENDPQRPRIRRIVIKSYEIPGQRHPVAIGARAHLNPCRNHGDLITPTNPATSLHRTCRYAKITPAERQSDGRVAQRERRCLTSTRSGVQIPPRPPSRTGTPGCSLASFSYPQTARPATNLERTNQKMRPIAQYPTGPNETKCA